MTGSFAMLDSTQKQKVRYTGIKPDASLSLLVFIYFTWYC